MQYLWKGQTKALTLKFVKEISHENLLLYTLDKKIILVQELKVAQRLMFDPGLQNNIAGRTVQN